MTQSEGLRDTAVRRRGRPVGTTSVETRRRILEASRQVINERGYQAATFQAISLAAGLSRPTLHYYFASREEIYQALVTESGAAIAGCVASVPSHGTLAERFSALVAAMHDVHSRDCTQIAFLVSARLESMRNPELRAHGSRVLRDFLATAVNDAKARGELADDAAVTPVVEMLHAMLWGIGFYAGFADDAIELCSVAHQLDRLLSRGLVD